MLPGEWGIQVVQSFECEMSEMRFWSRAKLDLLLLNARKL